MLLPTPVGHHYYTQFYVAAFLVNQALLLWEGHRRGYPLRTWLLTVAVVTLCFIIGTKLIAVPAAEWPALLRHGQWPASTARSVLGGAVAGTLAGLVLRRWQGYSWHMLDAFALPMCVALAVQCVGCLLTGCCFGELAGAGLGVSYAPGSYPFLIQLDRELISPDATHTLPVLPTQLYTLLLYLAVAAGLWATRRRPWPGGSRYLLLVTALLLGRFCIEFWRDPAGIQVGAALSSVGGLALKQVQWALLALLPGLLGWCGWLLRFRPPTPERIPVDNSVRNLLGVAALLVATALLGPRALTLPEMLVVKGSLLGVLVLEGAALLRAGLRQPSRRLALPLGLASVVLLFTNQVPVAPDSTEARLTLSFSPGVMKGGYDEEIISGGGSGCSGGSPVTRTVYDHKYRAAGGEAVLQVVNKTGNRHSFGLGFWTGSEVIGVRQINPNGPFLVGPADAYSTLSMYDVHAFFDWEHAYNETDFLYGYRIGVHYGQLHTAQRADLIHRLSINPDLMAYLGYRRATLQIDTGYGFNGLGNYTSRLGLGYRFGPGTALLAGLGNADHSTGKPEKAVSMGFVSGSVRLGRTGLVLEPSAATNLDRLYQVSMRLQYRLPLRKQEKP